MELDKALQLPAAPQAVWALLLDPEVMGECVPGMQSIEVVSATEYLAQIHVKISFISAKFKIRTTVTEQRAPHYLKSEGTGEDASVASSFKQTSEIFLEETADGATDVRMKIRIDLLGRLGTFGLSVMKTKADRMWDEFGVKLAERLAVPPPPAGELPPVAIASAPAPEQPAPLVQPPAAVAARSGGWWQRLWRGRRDAIQVVVVRGDTRIEVRWPLHGAQDCCAWLKELTGDAAMELPAAPASPRPATQNPSPSP